MGDIKEMVTTEPTKEEFAKLCKLKERLGELLVQNDSLSKPVRLAIAEHAENDKLLIKFLRGRKLQVQKAADSIRRYCEIRYDVYPELFLDPVPAYVRHVFDNRILDVLRNKDDMGRTIVMINTERWDTAIVTLDEIVSAGRYLVEVLMASSEVLTKGAILLIDCNGGSLSHAKQYTIPTVMKFVNVFWQAYPVPVKGVYIVNAPFFVKPVYTVLKPFLPSKLTDRILVTSGVKELHKRLPRSILPETLEGVLSNEKAMSVSCFSLRR